MNYKFSLTLVNLEIMSLERVSENKTKCEVETLKYRLLRIRNCIRTAMSTSPMSIFACHLGHFFAILKTQVSENSYHPFRQAHPTYLVFQSSTSRNLLFTEWHTGRDSTQRTRTVRVLRARSGGTTACNYAQFRPCFAPNLVLLVPTNVLLEWNSSAHLHVPPPPRLLCMPCPSTNQMVQFH